MRKIFIILCSVAFLFGVTVLPTSADSQMLNSISYAGTIPVLDANPVPDNVYGDTVVMYVKTPMLDDVLYEDLSDFSGSFYTVWKDGRLYFHLNLKGFSEGDSFELLFDLEDLNSQQYGANKTAKMSFMLNNGVVKPVCVVGTESSANVDLFRESLDLVSAVSEASCFVEFVLDFSMLYSDFSFFSGKSVGFDIVVSDAVDGGIVRYVWNDDTGDMQYVPDNLGTFILKAPAYGEIVEEDQDGMFDSDDANPGTGDACPFLYLLTITVTVVFITLSFIKVKK